MVPSVVRTRAADVCRRACESVGREIVRGRLVVWHRLLFRYLLVAHIRPNKLRRLPMVASVFSAAVRLFGRWTVPGFVCGDIVRPVATFRLMGIPRGSVRLGVYRVSAVLVDGE